MAARFAKAVRLCCALVGVGVVTPLQAEQLECGRPPANWGTETSRLYYQRPGGDWQQILTPADNLPALRQFHLAYVVRDDIDGARSGVVVMKTGRQMSPDMPHERTITLAREDQQDFVNLSCVPTAKFRHNGAKVPSDDYDGYHDYAAFVPSEDILDDFHIKYDGRHQLCKETNNVTPDQFVLLGRSPSNRSQFSFDPDVVKNGLRRPLLAQGARLLGINPAAAASTGLTDQKVEMRRYAIPNGSTTCVKFNVTITGPHFFLKIVDLEDRTRPDLKRTDEQMWMLAD